MNTKEMNEHALSVLAKGNFFEAQQLFQKYAKINPCAETYNNLGYYYYTEGMELPDGKTKNAKELSCRYLEKAWEMKPLVKTCLNIGYICYEADCYEDAYRYYEAAYKLLPTEESLYNMSIMLYMGKKYEACIKLLESQEFPPSQILHFFATVYHGGVEQDWKLANNQKVITALDAIDLLVLYYHSQQPMRIIELIPRLKTWGFEPPDWAMFVDALLSIGKEEIMMKYVKEKLDEKCHAKTIKKVKKMIRKKDYREQLIEGSRFIPQLIMHCGYEDCPKHQKLFDPYTSRLMDKPSFETGETD